MSHTIPETPAEVRAYLDKVQKAIDGRNEMIWAKYQYRCRRCYAIEWIGLGVGVEGPFDVRTKTGWIASPMGGMRCAKCGYRTTHVNWEGDRHFPPVDAPLGMRYFQFPRVISEEMIRNFNSIMFCGNDAVGTATSPCPEGVPIL